LGNNSKSRDSLAKRLISKDSKTFWSEVKALNGSGTAPLSSTVNGVVGNEKVANMWYTHYKNLLNSSKDCSDRQLVLDKFRQIHNDNFAFESFITPINVKDAIKGLKKGKAVGRDALAGEHFIYCSSRVYVLLSMLFSCSIFHGYLPSEMLDTIIVPIIKDKKGDITDKDNYRPVALTCIMSKVFEIVLLNVYEEYLATSPNLFGFKRGLSTDTCIFSLKQIIDYYRSMSSPIYLGFLDASKAFDKINHWTLFKKLLRRGLPTIIVRILYVWYSSQLFYVRWGSTLSKSFNVLKCVRQGSVI
jgi:hypothetical protein